MIYPKLKVKLSLAFLPFILLISLWQTKIVYSQEKIKDSSSINSVLEEAKASYQDENYLESIKLWQQLGEMFAQEKSYLNQATALSNIALNYQKIGEWNLAEKNILQSLNLVKNQPDSEQKLKIYAQILDIQAYNQENTGKLQQALETWQKTAIIYHQLKDKKLFIQNKINQAQALKNLGLYSLACKRFLESLNIDESECKISKQQLDELYTKTLSSSEIKSLIGLANLWRLLGKLEQSEEILTNLLKDNQKLSPSEESLVFFNLGNTEMALANKFYYLEDLFQSNRYNKKAFTNFQQASFPKDLISKTQTKTNQLNLLIQTQEWERANNLVLEILPLIKDLPINNSAIYIKNNLVKNLICLEQKRSQCFSYQQSQETLKSNAINPQVLNLAIEILNNAIQEANKIGDLKSESYSLGNLGIIYAQKGEHKKAIETLQKALIIAQSIQADEISYQWQWQLGKLSKDDNKQQAIIYYENSFNLLNKLRSDLVSLNQDVQFSFQESVEPVYREYVDLLLQDNPDQKQLKKSLEVMDSLKLAELNNFFKDNCIEVENSQLSFQDINRINPQNAIIYTIILPDRIEVITALHGEKLKNYKTYLPQQETDNQLNTILEQISEPNDFSPELLNKWYNYLITPIEGELKAKNISNLTFISDGLLRNIPLSALYDGSQYLIDKYSVAVVSTLQLIQPKSTVNNKFNMIAAGLSDSRYGFSELPGVEQELQNIQKITNLKSLLFNATFTGENFSQEIANNPSSIIHLATHGQFSSNVENTFVLAYDGPINIYELDKILRIQKDKNQPIELLVLSACETAKGDKRAALGLAGVAVKAGAKSTIASLWQVSDDSTKLLMTKFYQELKGNEDNLLITITKAQALQKAQKAVKENKDADYSHPFYWSAFVLVGNWQ